MLEQYTQLAVESLVESLQTMAFVSPLPFEQPPAAPSHALLASIDFEGPIRGRLEVLADQALGKVIAANITGTTPDDPQADVAKLDALRELTNVACGCLLARLPKADKRFQMMVPQMTQMGSEDWTKFTSSGAVLLDAEGSAVAIRLQEVK